MIRSIDCRSQQLIQNYLQMLAKRVSRSLSNVNRSKTQGQIRNQRPLLYWRLLWTSPFLISLMPQHRRKPTCSIHAKHGRVRSTLKIQTRPRIIKQKHRGMDFWRLIYALKSPLNAMRLLPRSHSIDFIKISTFPQNLTSNANQNCLRDTIRC